METIKVAFKSCLEEETLLTKTLKFVDPEEKEIGSVTIRQLTRRKILDLQEKPVEGMVLASIVEWTFKDATGKTLEVTEKNLDLLCSRKKVDNDYQVGIYNHLVDQVMQFNFVPPEQEKNSGGQSSSDS
jgi:hypothetical protein